MINEKRKRPTDRKKNKESHIKENMRRMDEYELIALFCYQQQQQQQQEEEEERFNRCGQAVDQWSIL